jgi:FixJ family two-component response regulator
MTTTATVFVVDDDASVRTGLTRLLRSAGFEVEAYGSGEQFVARVPFDGVGCLVLDLMMPGASGTELQQRLTALSSDLPVVFLSGHGAVSDGVRAMKQGAVDFLTKPVDEEVLLGTIEAAVARHRAARAARDERDAIRRRIETLTPREHEVMQCVIGGALNKQIAAYLGIAEGTVKLHRARALEKMAVTSVADLVRCCGVIGVEPTRCG